MIKKVFSFFLLRDKAIYYKRITSYIMMDKRKKFAGKYKWEKNSKTDEFIRTF